MQQNSHHKTARKHMWRKTNIKLLPSAIILLAGAMLATASGSLREGGIGDRLLALIGLVTFVVFSVIFLRVLTKTIAKLVAYYYVSEGRAASVQFLLRLIGYITIALVTLSLLEIPVGKLLLGGAAIGIILGVAAQQALANLFASIVLIFAHPFIVGEEVKINSGSLGEYEGTIRDIGLTHTKLMTKKGKLVLLPNATLLAWSAVTKSKAPKNEA